MTLYEDAQEIISFFEIFSIASFGVFLLLIVMKGISHPEDAITYAFQGQSDEIFWSVISGVVISIILFFTGIADNILGND